MLTTFELLQKYDVPGPRYTSYPTVPAWREDLPANSYLQSLQQVSQDDTLSLYFHLPFCENLCHFCGCFKIITKDHSRSQPYLQSLLREIKWVASHLQGSQKKVSQIHLGGGTPNFLQPSELAELMTCVRQHFAVLPDAEIAIEMHPRTSTKEFCDELKQQKFNRISLGVQSFDDQVQKLINRFQSFAQTQEMVEYLRSLGFASFNFDLIYGLPGDSVEKFAKTLDLTLKLNPDRLAVYSYAHVPWKSKIQRSFHDDDLPKPDEKLAMFALAIKTFCENGYVQIGMDHFAKTNDELFLALKNKSLHRNFMGYSTRADAHQIGFGVSSISFISGNYYQNVKDIDLYANGVACGEPVLSRGYELSTEDKIRRDLIGELMCHMQVDLLAFSKKHDLDFVKHFSKECDMLQTFVDDDLVEMTPKTLRITEPGKLALRNVCMLFDEYLDDVRKRSVNPVFSRTI